MIDDLVDEDTFKALFPARQRELISGHCQGIVARINAARSSDHADAIVHEACEAFQRECASTLVKNALFSSLDTIRKERWEPRA